MFPASMAWEGQGIGRSPVECGASVTDTLPMNSPGEKTGSDRIAERILAGVFAMAALFVGWRELEPVVLFRPAEAVVLSAGTYQSKWYTSRGRSHPYVGGRVFYRYELGGEPFVGFQYRRTSLFGDADVASRFAHDDRVRVWYNPLNRKDAVVSRQPEWLLLVPSTLMLILWARLEWVERMRRERREAAENHYGRSFAD